MGFASLNSNSVRSVRSFAQAFWGKQLLPRPQCLGFRYRPQKSQQRYRMQVESSKRNPEPEGEQATAKNQELRQLLAMLVRYPGFYGSAAVVLGYFLHISAAGSFHWDAGDAFLGLQLAAPVAVLDSLLMVPNYSPSTTIRQVKVKVPRAVADRLARSSDDNSDRASSGASSSSQTPDVKLWDPLSSSSSSTAKEETVSDSSNNGDGSIGGSSGSVNASGGAAVASPDDLVEVEHAFPVGVDQHPLLAALHRLQREKASSNAALGLSIPSELLLLATFHLASEMLWRAVLLVAATSWLTDLLYAAGLDDWLYMQGGDLHAAVPQVGAAVAVAICTVASAWSAARKETYPLRLMQKLEKAVAEGRKRMKGAQENSDGQDGEQGAASPRKQRLNRLFSEMKTKMTSRRRWSLGVEVARNSTETACYSIAYLLTGNLLAPYVAAVANDLLFSLYQRARQHEVEKEQRAALEKLGDLATSMEQLRGERVARLQPKRVEDREGKAVSHGKQDAGSPPEEEGDPHVNDSGSSSRSD